MTNMKILLSLVVPALVRGHVDAVNLGLVKMGGNFASYDSDNTGYESTSECEGELGRERGGGSGRNAGNMGRWKMWCCPW